MICVINFSDSEILARRCLRSRIPQMSRIGWSVKRAVTKRFRLRYSCSSAEAVIVGRVIVATASLRRDSTRLIIHSRTNSARMIIHGSTASFVYFFSDSFHISSCESRTACSIECINLWESSHERYPDNASIRVRRVVKSGKTESVYPWAESRSTQGLCVFDLARIKERRITKSGDESELRSGDRLIRLEKASKCQMPTA